MHRWPNRASRIAAALFLLTTACGRGGASVGPLTIDVPSGWRVADNEGGDLKLTDGTIADENSTKPGTATTVFDVYVPSAQTLSSFLVFLREQKIVPKQEAVVIGGYQGVVLS